MSRLINAKGLRRVAVTGIGVVSPFGIGREAAWKGAIAGERDCDELRAAVGNASNEVDAVFLHHLLAVLEDGRAARQQILDGRLHLAHAHHVDDGLERIQDAAQHLGILLA